MTKAKIPYSVLDLATIIEGNTAADSFRNSLSLARYAEKCGYHRFWLAEHHNMDSVASSATAVLIGHIAGGTSKMRVGSGGIMLPNHSPLIVAEQFGTLESLYPGRIDLGLGRAPGTDHVAALAIRRKNFAAEHNFPEDILELQRLFSAANSSSNLRAIPGEGLEIPIWILGSSTDSARVAAALGLPYAFASHFAPTYFLQAIELYRKNFKPSGHLTRPYVMACVNVVAAATDEQASLLASSVQQLFIGVISGKRRKLQPPVNDMNQAWTPEQAAAVKHMLTYSFIGSRASIGKKMSTFLAETAVDEIMATSHIYDHEDRLQSYGIFADVMNKI